MIVKERKIELMKLASSAVYKEYSDIQKPKNTEEENFYNSWLITYMEDKKESEDFKNKYELAKEEIQELVNQYVCNDYKFGGKFNNPIFKLKEKKIDLLVEKELQKHPEVQKDLVIDVFIIDTKKRLFQEIYKINWNPKVIKDAKEFEKKYYEIIEKYDVSDCYDIKDFL